MYNLGLLVFLMTSELICHNFSKKKKDEVNNSLGKIVHFLVLMAHKLPVRPRKNEKDPNHMSPLRDAW